MAGAVMYPNLMKEKTKNMLGQLNQLAPYAEKAYEALIMPQIHVLHLRGKAWKSVREYMGEVQLPLMKTYQLWIEEQKMATAAYYAAACCLPNVRCLDEDGLESIKHRYERWLDREYSREHPSHSRIAHYRRMIREMNLKLTAMRVFMRTTGSLFNRPSDLLSILEKADAQLRGVGLDPASGIISYASIDDGWLLEMQEEVAGDYLVKLGIPFVHLERMKKLGLSSRDMKAAYGRLRTKEDEEFFIELLNERYREAFQVNPKELSKETEFILAGYTQLLLDKGKVEELRQLMNEMLYTDEEHSPYPNHQNRDAYGIEYTQMLYDVTTYLLEENGKMFLMSKDILTEEGGKRLGDSMRELAHLNALWGSVRETAFGAEYFYESGIESKSGHLMYGGRLADLEYYGGDFKYDMMYSTAAIKELTVEAAGKNIREIEWKKDCLLEVRTLINTDSHAIYDEKFRERIKELENRKETLWAEYAVNRGIGVLSAFYPEVGLVYGLVTGIADEDAGKAGDKTYLLLDRSGLIKQEALEKYKSGGRASITAAAGLLDYSKAMKRLDKEIASEKAQKKLEWFGATSSFRAGSLTGTVNAGYYNVDALEALMDWEEGGFSSMLEKKLGEKVDWKKMTGNLKTQLMANGEYNNAVSTLIEGGDIMGMDTVEFVDAVSNINTAYLQFYAVDGDKKNVDGPCGNKLDMEGVFQMSISKERTEHK